MAIAITAIISFFATINVAIVGFVLMWYRSCRMAENENTKELLKAEAEIIKEINDF
jgi:hypothetical protein